MSVPDNPQGREETYLASISGKSVSIPKNPQSREEEYLAHICGANNVIPKNPQSRKEEYLKYIAENGTGGGGSFEIVTDEVSIDLDDRFEDLVVELGFRPKLLCLHLESNYTDDSGNSSRTTSTLVVTDNNPSYGFSSGYTNIEYSGEEERIDTIDYNSYDTSITLTDTGFRYNIAGHKYFNLRYVAIK